jgi:hypothetical protein
MSTLDADALATLTPEEREAIEGSEHSEADLEALKKIAGDADDDSDADDSDNDEEEGDEEAPPAEGKTAAEPEAEKPADPPAVQPEPAAPRYEAKLPSDYDDQIKSLKDRDAELRQRFKDGEIDIDERDAGLAELAEQREQLLVLRAKAEISQEMNQQSAAQQWQNAVNKALNDFAKPEQGGIDYRQDTDKQADLDQFVKLLANKSENADKSMEWFLQEAHKRVLALHGVAPVPKKETVAEAIAKRKPPVDAAPKTLAQVPGSDGPGDVGSEFADIEALEGMEYEDAIARMSPSQREKFLRGR